MPHHDRDRDRDQGNRFLWYSRCDSGYDQLQNIKLQVQDVTTCIVLLIIRSVAGRSGYSGKVLHACPCHDFLYFFLDSVGPYI